MEVKKRISYWFLSGAAFDDFFRTRKRRKEWILRGSGTNHLDRLELYARTNESMEDVPGELWEWFISQLKKKGLS